MLDFHLHLSRFLDPKAIAGELLEAGVQFNNIACEPWEWEKSLELGFAGAFGIHPMIAARSSREDLKRLEEILHSNEDFAVGECGLDKRFQGYEEGGIQEQIFKKQVELACGLNRTLQVHCVGDYGRVLSMIQDVTAGIKCGEHHTPSRPQVVLHRFGGDISAVRFAIKTLGSQAVFSLHPDSFRKKATIAAIGEIPSSQVRFETDADDESWTAAKIMAALRDVQRQYADLFSKR